MKKMTKLLGLSSFVMLISMANSWAVAIPESYRTQHYRAPTPDYLPGGDTLSTAALQQLLQKQPEVVLIDVMAAIYRPESALFEGEWLLSQPRYNIPGSIWLPNVGYGQLDAVFLDYFQDNLARITEYNQHHPLVFYCIENCWMAWNAGKRAQTLGYTQIYWYKEGVDGWQAAGLPVKEVHPVPLTVKSATALFEAE